MSRFVVVGRDTDRLDREPVLAIGPFESREGADEFRDLLDRASSGTYTVVSLHTPTSNHPDARIARGQEPIRPARHRRRREGPPA